MFSPAHILEWVCLARKWRNAAIFHTDHEAYGIEVRDSPGNYFNGTRFATLITRPPAAMPAIVRYMPKKPLH